MAENGSEAAAVRQLDELRLEKLELKRRNEELRQDCVALREELLLSESRCSQLQRELLEVRDQLEEIFQAAPLAMGIFDRQGRLVKVNPACQHIFGWTAQELKAKFPWPVLAEVSPGSLSLQERVLQGERLIQVEIRQHRKDGEPVEVSFSASPCHDAEGRVSGFIGLAEDITVRKRSQRAMQTQARVLANMAEGVVVTDAHGDIIYTNPAFDRMFGYEPGELLGLNSSCLHARPAAEYFQLVKDIVGQINQTGSWHGEFLNLNKAGTSFYTRAHVSVLTGDGSTLYISVQEDITEGKLSAEALQQERDFSAALLDTLGALVVVLDRQGRIVLFNQASENLSGYAFKEVQGKPFYDFFLLPDELEGVKKVFQNLIQGDFPNTFVNHWVSRSGQKFLISWSNTTLKDSDGAVMHIIGTGIDITKQHLAEEALLQAHGELERRVLSRTEQLRQTVDKLLQEINIREEAESRLRASEARFAAFMRHLPGSAIMRDREGKFLFVNESWEVSIRRRPGESLGKTVFDFWPQEVAQRLHDYDQEVFTQNRPLESIVELPLDGKIHTFLSHRFPIPNEAGEVEMVGAIGIDITERLKAEEARDRLIEILEATPDFVGSADREGRLFYLNRAAKKMLGLTPQDDISTMTFAITHPAWALELVLSEGRPVYAREGSWRGESAILRRDGAEIPVSQVILAHRSPEGKIKFFSTICRDITERKLAEENLKKSEEKLRLLTTQLLTAQEDERKRLATELHDELGHALLTLKLHLSSVERNLLPQQADLKEKMRQIEAYLTDTVEEVRRLYHALSPGDLEDLGLTTALRNMVEDFREFYTDIEWNVEIADLDNLFSLPIQTMIYRIVQEALTNIGKHAYPGHVRVKVSRTGQQAVFVIEDDGRGFPMDEVVDGDKRGMGLAAMGQRVSLAGGVFDLWSQEDQGTRIVFNIPCYLPGETG